MVSVNARLGKLMENTRYRLLVYGRVQGVLFRKAAQRKARELGLTGWAKNLIDGTVEVVVEGPKEKADEFMEWAKQGPPLAKVEKVDVGQEEYTGEFKEFSVREFGF